MKPAEDPWKPPPPRPQERGLSWRGCLGLLGTAVLVGFLIWSARRAIPPDRFLQTETPRVEVKP